MKQTSSPITSLAPGSFFAPGSNDPASNQGLLPHALYFLSHPETAGPTQVWRLAPDGSTLTQITHEEEDVINFDVSLENRTMAYVVGDQLFRSDTAGGNRLLLVSGVSSASTNGPDLGAPLQSRLNTPLWSPDGKTLAFGYNGVNLYRPETGAITRLLPNGPLQTNGAESSQRSDVSFSPYLWSPDSAHLLVDIAFPNQGSTLGILSISTGEVVLFTRATGEAGDLICCQAYWTPDGKAVYIANPYFTEATIPGLWRYDPYSRVGETLIPFSSPDGTYNYVGWPVLDNSGQLVYFFGNLPNTPSPEMPLTLVRSDPDGMDARQSLRMETFLLREVLWFTETQPLVAVVIQPPPGQSDLGAVGPVVLVHSDGSAIQPLVPSGSNLRWGP